MAKIATKQQMLDDGWKLQYIAGVECFVLDRGSYKMIGQNSRDGFTSRRVATLISKELGKPYKIHQFWDPNHRHYKSPRITTLEY